MKEDGGEEVEEGGGGGGEGGGERGRVAEVTKDPKVATLQHFVGAQTEKSQATPAQKSQVTPDRSHERPLYRKNTLRHYSTLHAEDPILSLCLPVGESPDPGLHWLTQQGHRNVPRHAWLFLCHQA